MPESYEAIIEEIKKCHILDYAARYGINTAGTSLNDDYRNCIKHIAARVREAVGGDPAEWWVECNGERVKVGDKVEAYSNEYEVFALGPERVIYNDGYRFDSIRADLVRKVIPDTREKIIEDTLDELTEHRCLERFTGAERAIIAKAIDRAMKLAEVDDVE